MRDASEVRELLNRETTNLLELCGIEADWRLITAIRGEIDAAIEIYGIEVGKVRVGVRRVCIGLDAAGGRILQVILVANNELFHIPVTGHLHDIAQGGRIPREEFIYSVDSILEEFNLSDEDMGLVRTECLRLMRKEKLIKR